MKTNLSRIIILFFLLLACFGLSSFRVQTPIVRQSLTSPTPTYDPFAEPPLPANPTELELGRNLYWHWCMPCHGDRGQGLTDEFRAYWVSDHQNCWARGCHNGHGDNMGFPIPTIVPGIVEENHLAQFTNLQEFADFLKATHPPQSPGALKDEEYHAIALFVFTMNGRMADGATATPIPTSTATLVPVSESTLSSQSVLTSIITILAIFLIILVFTLIIRRKE
jgi:hypothetical protein